MIELSTVVFITIVVEGALIGAAISNVLVKRDQGSRIAALESVVLLIGRRVTKLDGKE